jgi:hypothetical protein
MRRPGATGDEPPGGRAAERLREHLRDRFGTDELPPEDAPREDEDADEDQTPAAEESDNA